jgi:hydroxymethylpyrimidine/phosphomethylpyrimidine kinase
MTRLIPHATLATPNAEEAATLASMPTTTTDEIKAAARTILAAGAKAVMVTGGDVPGDIVTDYLITDQEFEALSAPRIETTSTHGTGCTFASAVAASLAQGISLRPAIERARAYVRAAIQSAPGYGKGQGPLDHSHSIPPFEPKALND